MTEARYRNAATEETGAFSTVLRRLLEEMGEREPSAAAGKGGCGCIVCRVAAAAFAELPALLDVVDAIDNFDGDLSHPHDCEYRTAAKGWKPGEPPVIECVCGMDALEAALSRLESTDA